MPRVTYADRFTALLARPLNSRDRTFCESLQSFYLRKGRLTAGRARCVRELEERYSASRMAEAAERGGPMLKRLSALSERVEGNKWASQFVMSLSQQVHAGRDLTPRQEEILEKIETENNDAAIASRATWADDYRAPTDALQGATPQEVAKIAATYYVSTGYFKDLAQKVLSSDDFTPSQKAYRKMTENKFAQKILAAHQSAPKYAVGSFVTLRASAGYTERVGTGNRPCVIIQANAAPVTSPAKGAKKYKVLPVGLAKPVIVEERHLKAARGMK